MASFQYLEFSSLRFLGASERIETNPGVIGFRVWGLLVGFEFRVPRDLGVQMEQDGELEFSQAQNPPEPPSPSSPKPKTPNISKP